MTALIIAKIAPWLIGLFATFATAFGLYRRGKHAARDEAKIAAAEQYAKTRKAIDNAQIPDDPAVLRDWLRARDPGVK